MPEQPGVTAQQKEPRQLGGDLVQALAQLLAHNSRFLDALHQARPLFFRGTVTALQTSGGMRQVQVTRAGQSSAEAYWYPIYDAGYSATVGDDVLLLYTDRRLSACVIGGRTRGVDPYAGASSVTLGSAVGQGRAHDLGAGGTPPASWYALAYDDSAWTAPVAETAGTFGAPEAGSAWVTYADGSRPASDVWLLRHAFSLPAGTVLSATVTVNADDYIEAVYVNGTAITTSEVQCPPAQTYTVPASLLVCGAGATSNVLAIHVKNGTATSGNPTSADYLLRVSYAGAGQLLAIASPQEGDLAVYVGGAWQRRPVGPSGDVLASDGTDPGYSHGAINANARLAVAINDGGTVSTRRQLDVKAGSGVTLAVADDGAGERAQLTISATGGSGALTRLAQTVLAASAASITFGSISGSYSTLLLCWDARGDAASTNNTPLLLQVNSDTGSTYLWVYGRAQSGNAALFSEVDSGGLATSLHVGDMPGATGLANASGGGRIELPNYAGATFYKHLSAQWGFATGTTAAGAFYQSYFGYGQWDSTAAITALVLFPSSGNFIAGTVMTLYGLS